MRHLFFLFTVIGALALACSDKKAGDESNLDAGDSDRWTRDTGTGQAPDTGTGQAPDTGTGEAPDTGTGEPPDTGTGQAMDTETDTGTGMPPDTGTGEPPDTGTGMPPDTGTGEPPDTGTGQAMDTETDTGTGELPDTGTGPAMDTETATLSDSDLMDGGPGPDGGREDTGWETEEFVDAGICVELELYIERRPVRVMVLEDRSLSMDDAPSGGDTKWEIAVDSISQLVANYEDQIQFGLDLFTSLDARSGRDGYCDVASAVHYDVAPANADVITDALTNTGPAGATPLLLAMQNFTDPEYAPVFSDGAGDSYLIIVSDGMDTCSADGTFRMDEGASAQELADAAAQIYQELNIQTIVVGFGEGINPEQLNAIAEAGGFGRDTYYDASDVSQLDAVLDEIGQAVAVSCTFEIGEHDEEEVNLDWVNVHFNDVPVPRDNGCDDPDAGGWGWTWTDSSRTAIEFCETSCDILSGTAVEEVSVTIACRPEDVIII